MSGIDYSKWDKMDFSDDDSSTTRTENVPQVTQLDEASQVTFSADGLSIVPSKVAHRNHSKDPKPASGGTESVASRSDGDEQIPETTDKSNKFRSMTKNGGTFMNPVTKLETYWSQDRSEVLLSVLYDHSTITSRDIRVKVTGAFRYEDRYAAVGGYDDDQDSSSGKEIRSKLVVSVVGQDVSLLEGIIPYHIHLSEGEDEIDWEIDVTDPSEKFIRITLLKAVPMQGLTVWWSRPLLQFPEIDVVADIEGRNVRTSDNSTNSNQHEQWKDTWEEAHMMFREKVKERKKHVV